LWTICPGCLQTMILLIFASWGVSITGLCHLRLAKSSFDDLWKQQSIPAADRKQHADMVPEILEYSINTILQVCANIYLLRVQNQKPQRVCNMCVKVQTRQL
jgi:hypothetical protein